MGKIFVVIILSFLAGYLVRTIINIIMDGKPKPALGGVLVIRKNEEAVDGQILFQKGLYELSEAKEVLFKVKIIPGEPGEEKKE